MLRIASDKRREDGLEIELDIEPWFRKYNCRVIEHVKMSGWKTFMLRNGQRTEAYILLKRPYLTILLTKSTFKSAQTVPIYSGAPRNNYVCMIR
jgi:hypothetical protein